MALVVLGLFVLVWIISAVVKASQNAAPKRPPNRPRPVDGPRIERTSNSDIDRFMAEIDRLRRKGEGAPSGRAADQSRQAPRPIADRPSRTEPRPKPVEPRREKDRERRQRQPSRAVPAPPPLPRTESVPVLRPVMPDAPTPPSTTASAPIKPARTAKTTATTVVSSAPGSPVTATVQALLRSGRGPAAAVILAEVFGEPRGRRPMQVKGQPKG